MEVALGIELKLAGVDKAGLDHLAVGLVTAFLCAEAQVGDTAALAADAIALGAIEAGVAVQVVEVVGADLGGFVGGCDEAWKVRVGELRVHPQGDAQQAREVAKAFGADLRIGRRLGAQDLLAAAP
ncbi:hypothetical protein NP522_13770 [Pseudomonas guariconensis]|uniref:hypothetical protein n=1 Tax=Pseudomonas guariconensis TaxID=1288410 RepID=UPI0023638354|nr:hypothetical protein [Pseudomonas guariconensis]MDD2091247.1 hypothetical protein [Pseudomonas guariconensis]